MKKVKLIMESWRKYLNEDHDMPDPADDDIIEKGLTAAEEFFAGEGEAPEEMDQEFALMKKLAPHIDKIGARTQRIASKVKNKLDFQKYFDADTDAYYKQADKAAWAKVLRTKPKGPVRDPAPWYNYIRNWLLYMDDEGVVIPREELASMPAGSKELKMYIDGLAEDWAIADEVQNYDDLGAWLAGTLYDAIWHHRVGM